MHHASWVVGAVALLAGAAALPRQQQPTSGGGARMGRDMEGSGLALDRWQPKALPSLPSGMTLAIIRTGDSVYHGKGGCVACHGADAFGMPNAGSGVTMGLNFIPIEWKAIDSLVTAGIPEEITRSSIAMPARGAASNLTPEEVRQVAAYIWAIARTSDEPWPGGHRTHEASGQVNDTSGGTKRP